MLVGNLALKRAWRTGLFILWISGHSAWGSLVIHEVAWMGTARQADHQWVELYNHGGQAVALEGWSLRTRSGSVSHALRGQLGPGHTLLLAAGADPFIAGIPIHQFFEGTLDPDGEVLELRDPRGRVVDVVDAWYAGCADRAATMQRVYPYVSGTVDSSWKTATVRYDVGYGTPGWRRPPAHTGQVLHQVYHGPQTMNVFFNQSALTELAQLGNPANHAINIEERVVERIRQARHRIDIALYEINLPNVVDALRERAAEGVQVRLLIDAKDPRGGERNYRYRLMRVYLEQLARGRDGQLGSADSVHIFANSPIFAVIDADMRAQFGLPRDAAGDIAEQTLQIGGRERTGRLLVEAAERVPGVFYHPSGQMHNKFVLIDDYRVLTGSMNFTETGVYGTERNRLAGIPGGNSNNLIDLHCPEITEIYRAEFNQMWGSESVRPDAVEARFRSQKRQHETPHYVQWDDMLITVLFSTGYDVIPYITSFVEREAEESVYFCIFAWSDYQLEKVLKEKWEGTAWDTGNALTGFRLKGVFERLFWNQWWSANINMQGRTPSRSSSNHPNIRWEHRPPIFQDREPRKLHHKYMLVDADTAANPAVITGSANWSRNANDINDENTLIIENARIANQFLQEFYARYTAAGGTVYDRDALQRAGRVDYRSNL